MSTKQRKVMSALLVLASGLLIFSLAGCSNDGPYSGHSKKWYGQHHAQAKQEIKWCSNQSIHTMRNDKYCTRAAESEY